MGRSPLSSTYGVFYFMAEEKEIWKDVVGYEGLYQVSNLGRVKSFQKVNVRVLKPLMCWDGYVAVMLCNNNKKKRTLIHRIVASAFIDNPENKKTVNHINGIKSDNRAKNLEWNTQSENSIHAHKTGLKKAARGEKSGGAKLRRRDVLYIKSKKDDPCFSALEMAIKYNVARCTICSIVNNKSWKHL